MLFSIYQLVLPLIVPTIASAIATFIVWQINKWSAFLRNKVLATHNLQTVNLVLQKLELFAQKAVFATEQTVVDNLKKRNEWGSKESYDIALNEAMRNLRAMALADLPVLVQAGYTSVDSLLKTLIEAAIKEYFPKTIAK
jgi:hypothetical protein